MNTAEALDRLAQLAGIEEGWWDFFGHWRPVSAATKKTFLTAMGVAVADDSQILASLDELENRSWRRWLEPVTVLDETWAEAWVALTLPAARDSQMLHWSVEDEHGWLQHGTLRVDNLPWAEERPVDGVLVKRWRLVLPQVPAVGYHRLRVDFGDGQTAETRLIVAPARAHVPAAVAGDHRAWGLATQVYALRNERDWGVGTYGALAELAAGAARLGAATIGVNPLHALFPSQPDKFSPYAPSSRRFLNVAYLDVEAIPEFKECLEAKRMFASPGFQANVARLRSYPLVEYEDVAQLTYPVLEVLYKWFVAEHVAADDARARQFHDFQRQGGRVAELFCTFEALHEHFLKQGVGYWRQWPEGLRRPDGPEVAAFAHDHGDRVNFFWWLQFVADQQLAAAHQAAKAAGAAIGLYRDLGVGIAGDGAEAWLQQDKLALGVSVGAPPDPLAPKGQDWGLIPFNPLAMRESAYDSFIGVMRANMRHAGALRLDHAMSLQRLYWVPPGAGADQGAYVRFPVDDLFRLVALESVRNQCLVIGEDLGTVPEGFRERMDRTALFAYRVMVFEQRDGRFKTPAEFDENALSIFATHDLPSARGYWNGTDIGRRERLDLYPDAQMAEGERVQRQGDRERLVRALAAEGLLPGDFSTHGPLSDGDSERLTLAAHLFLARSRSRLMMVQIEDVLGLDSQMNLPGTTTQHPNWRHRFPVEVSAILDDARLKELAKQLGGVRRG